MSHLNNVIEQIQPETHPNLGLNLPEPTKPRLIAQELWIINYRMTLLLMTVNTG